MRIGPFSHLRPGAHVGAGAELGNFAEVKAATLGAGSKQHHFSYLGDAQVGEGVNIGAGTITANYDGQRKHRTVIGDGAFIGSDTILRAPVTIGEGAVTGAGSVVTHDVPAAHHGRGRAGARPHRRRRPTATATPGRADGRPRRARSSSACSSLSTACSWPPRSRSSRSAGAGSSSSSTRATRAPGGSTGSSASPGRFLAVLQLGITFVGFLAAAFAGAEHRPGAGGLAGAGPGSAPRAASRCSS